MRKNLALALFCCLFTVAAQAEVQIDQSLLREARVSVRRGSNWLLDRQAENGAWSNEPSITALAMQALLHTDADSEEIQNAVARGREFILKSRRPDGAFVGSFQEYANYTTATSLSVLAMIDHPDDQEVMRKARRFLMELQLREEHAEVPTAPDSPFYGGIGYGSGGPTVPDLSNTQFALEALYLTEHLDRDTPQAEQARATWVRAISYLQSVQHVPEDAEAAWRPDPEQAPEYDGGFIYRPDQCRVREKLTREFEGQPISYGATTMGGLKSLLFAEVDKDDHRVQAAIDWLKRNYTLEENPVIGAEAHFYYLWTFAKAMQAYGQETLELADGQTRHWRSDLVRQLLEMQKSDGHWINEESGRYMESIPELTTAYALIAMQVALGD